MSKTTEALKLAEEVLDMVTSCSYGSNTRERVWSYRALAAIREVLADHSGDANEMVAPEGYALISIDALKAWGKYDVVKNACKFSAEPVKQEPVAEFEVGIGENGEAKFDSFRFMLPKHFPAGQYKLYAAPVSAEAIRAEALEEAAEWCDRLANNGSLDAEDCAAAIRGLK